MEAGPLKLPKIKVSAVEYSCYNMFPMTMGMAKRTISFMMGPRVISSFVFDLLCTLFISFLFCSPSLFAGCSFIIGRSSSQKHKKCFNIHRTYEIGYIFIYYIRNHIRKGTVKHG
jgi:hypothetical protein